MNGSSFRSSRWKPGSIAAYSTVAALGSAFRRGERVLVSIALLLSFCFAATCLSSARAAEPDEILDDPVLEARAVEISRNLRCVVCQSQSIDDSNAPLAKDMRLIVRERLVAGDTDEEIYAYLVDRYGNYVLLKPPVQRNTFILWAAPFFFLVAFGLGVGVYLIRMSKTAGDDLEPEDIDSLS
ncbi:MAG: cytochrome c-type biogenesis protein [Pseudomonadota bacterium]